MAKKARKAKKATTKGPASRSDQGGLTRKGVRKTDAGNKSESKSPDRKNKIHVSLFVDGQEVTLIDEFNTPAEAVAATREFLNKHAPEDT
jgi:hypothetical protein